MSEQPPSSLSLSSSSSTKREAQPQPAHPPRPQCQFWLPKKRRYCPLLFKVDDGGPPLCPDHRAADRVPCPYDPGHGIAKHQLKKHLLVCKSRPKENPVYFSSDINVPSNIIDVALDGKTLFVALPADTQKSLTDRLCDLANRLLEESPIESMILSHPSLSSKLDTTSFGKHAHQHSTLLGHIEKMGCLDKTNVFLELGAGKAEFSHHVHMAVGNPSKFILLDRKATRLKVNRSKEDISPAGTWERVLMDLKDFNLGAYPVEHFKDAFTGIFAFSKHLCGAATDMGLRCLTNYATQIHPLPLKGILIALCCHHQCNFRCYVNHEFIRQLKLTDEDFAMLKSLSSWAISGFKECECKGEDSFESLPATNFTYNDRVRIGKACKHILNIGRLKYLEQLGFNAKLVEYVDPKYTLENVALVVLPKTINPIVR